MTTLDTRSPTLHLERVKHEEDVRYRSSSRVKAKSHHTGVARTLPSTLLLANIIMGVTFSTSSTSRKSNFLPRNRLFEVPTETGWWTTWSDCPYTDVPLHELSVELQEGKRGLITKGLFSSVWRLVLSIHDTTDPNGSRKRRICLTEEVYNKELLRSDGWDIIDLVARNPSSAFAEPKVVFSASSPGLSDFLRSTCSTVYRRAILPWHGHRLKSLVFPTLL